ncbi:IS3 family transposase [Desulfopila aestuarii]
MPCGYNAAATEAFFYTLKTQLTHHERFMDKYEVELGLFNYIETCYNRRRRHTAIGCRITAEFELYIKAYVV